MPYKVHNDTIQHYRNYNLLWMDYVVLLHDHGLILHYNSTLPLKIDGPKIEHIFGKLMIAMIIFAIAFKVNFT